MHTGQNFNGSSFDKSVVNAAIPTLANTPVLAFIEENSNGEQDFSDHRMVLHRATDGGVELKYLGSAVGVIPEDNNARWETRVTDDGEELEYLVVDALMWTKWDDPINIMKEKGFTSQSMELSDEYSGTWDNNGVFHFESFSFFGACLLGEDVMPAMKNSTAEIQFSKNKVMKNTIEDKLQEFYTLFSQEGGNNMAKENEEKVVADFEGSEAVVETVEVVDEAVEAVQTADEVIANADSDNPDGSNEEFNASDDTNSDTTSEELEATEINAEADEESTDATDTNEEDAVDFEAKFTELNENYTVLTADHEALQNELAELKSYKRKREEDDVKAKFEGKLSDEEFTEVFSEMKDSELDKVEEKLFALIGRKNFSIQSTQTIDANKIKLAVAKDDEKTSSPYDALKSYLN